MLVLNIRNMIKRKHLLPVIALVLASVLWGINVPLVKLGLQSIPLTVFISIKFMLASLIFLPFALKTWKPLKQKEMGLLVISSLLYITTSTVALNIGLKHAPSINSAIISLLGPLLLCVFAVQFLKEKMALKTIVGVIIAFIGAAIIIGKPWDVSLGGPGVLFGNLMFFVAVLSGVISTLIAKPILGKISSYQATFIILLVGTLPIVPFALMQLKTWNLSNIAPGGFIALIYGIIAIPLANFFHIYGLKYKEAHSVGIFEYIEKVVLIIAAWFILGEYPSPKFAIGAALTFLGVYLAEVRLPKKLSWYRLNKGR